MKVGGILNCKRRKTNDLVFKLKTKDNEWNARRNVPRVKVMKGFSQKYQPLQPYIAGNNILSLLKHRISDTLYCTNPLLTL